MCRNTRVLTLAAVVVSLLVVGGLQAQTTTGRLIGTVIDEDGAGLPGVAVTITSDVLIGGPQSAVTDDRGGFQFISLFPGEYVVQASLSGFVTQERQEVRVPLGGAASLIIEMPSGTFESEIEVISETPVIDPTQVNTEQVFNETYLQNGAVGTANRGYMYIIGQTAGVVGTWNPNVFGSSLGENAWYIDGQDTTDPVTATVSTVFNYDAIAEVEIQTSGFEAEYGRATGGLTSVITKSGGNQFSGTVDLRYRDTNFYTDGDHYDTSTLDTKYEDYAFTLGGPIVSDKLWFFGFYEDVNSERTPNLSPTTRDWEGTNYGLKLTWQAAPSWRVVGKYTDSPTDIYNDNASQFRQPEANSYQSQGGAVSTFELNSVLSDSLMWNTMIGTYRYALDSFPMSGDLETAGHYNFDTGMYTVNYTNQQYSERNRDDAATDLTWFVDNLAGSHEFKGGIQYSGTEFSAANCSTGTTGGACTPGSYSYRYEDRNWFGPQTPYFMWEYFTQGPQAYDGTLYTAYVQDSWRVLPNVTLKLGVRYDQIAYDNNVGTEIADLSKVQPRIGGAWDITGDAKNVVRFNWGRFMHPSALTLPSFARAANEPYARYYSCSTIGNYLFGWGVETAEECEAYALGVGYAAYNPGYDGTDPLGWFLHPAELYGTGQNFILPGLKPAYADSVSIGFERQIANRASIGITYVDKKTRDIFEDTCEGNLGSGGPSADASCDRYVLTNLPWAKRDYEGVMLTFESRTWSWLTLNASYTYSESKGSIEYTQGAYPDFDIYPYHFENRYGYLSDHRKHRVKLNGFVLLPYDFTIGFDGFYSSAFTWEPRDDGGLDPDIPYDEYFLEPRGSRKGFTAYNLDLQVTKGFTIANRVRLALIGTIYNTFSTEYGTAVCDIVYGCGDYEMGDATTWTTPRRYEVGFRVEF
jgi:hypothetical protein